MVREYLKLSSGPTPWPLFPTISPPRQEVRGPAGEADVVSRRQKPPQFPFPFKDVRRKSGSTQTSMSPTKSPPRQVERGPAGEAEVGSRRQKSPQFKENFAVQEQTSVSKVVQDLNKFCWQKPAGSFQFPELVSSPYCTLCNRGCTCLGGSCKGFQKPTEQTVNNKILSEPSSIIPGQQEDANLSTSVLTTPTFSSTRKTGISAISPGAPIYNWTPNNTANTSPIFSGTKPSSSQAKSSYNCNSR